VPDDTGSGAARGVLFGLSLERSGTTGLLEFELWTTSAGASFFKGDNEGVSVCGKATATWLGETASVGVEEALPGRTFTVPGA